VNRREFVTGLREAFARWQQTWEEQGLLVDEPTEFRFSLWRLMDGIRCDFRVTPFPAREDVWRLAMSSDDLVPDDELLYHPGGAVRQARAMANMASRKGH